MRISFLIFILLYSSLGLRSQVACTAIGQNPATAFPVCGVDTFRQTSVPLCNNGTIQTFCNDGVTYQGVNPFWYRFTCFQSGTLGFLITPDSLTDDYDWVLFDITNHSPNEVFSNTGLIVTYNWSGNTSLESARGYTGITGTAPMGTLSFACATNPKELGGNPPFTDAPTINKMPTILQGHTYLLMVSHFTQTQTGYALAFTGGTAVITDPGIPSIQSAHISCGEPAIAIKLSKMVRCSSLDPDGSDFLITPSSAAVVKAAGVNCGNGFDMDSVILTLDNILPAGVFTVSAKTGGDGNTLLDDCGNSIADGNSAVFISKDTVNATFGYQIHYGCHTDSIQLNNPGGNGVNSWNWTIDSFYSSSVPNPLFIDSVFGNKSVRLIVSNGVCNDTATATIALDNYFKAGFDTEADLCPGDKAVFTNSSVGNIISWNWDFGDGTFSADSVPPPHLFPNTPSAETYTVKLIVQNNFKCSDTAIKQITKVKSCYIDVPTGFTPNGDGVNDYLYPLNAYKAVNLEFRIYNRYGQLVFETRDWTKKWDGTINGKLQPTGTYVWMLKYQDRETGKQYFLKGTSVLVR